MTCAICPAHPSKGDTVLRVNPTGEAGIWACEEHYDKVSQMWLQGKIAPGKVVVEDK